MRKTLLLLSIVAVISNSGCSNNNQITKAGNSVGNNVTYLESTMRMDAYKNQVLSHINNIRLSGATCGAPTKPLNWNNTLENVAKAQSKDMALNNFVSHIGSGTALDPAKPSIGVGSTFVDRIEYFGYGVRAGQLVGENITRTNIKSVKSTDIMPNFKRAMTIIVNDKPHCEILMNPRFQDIGVAMYRRGGHYYFAMELAERK